MIKLFIVLLFLLVLSNSELDSEIYQQFKKFIIKYHKNYNSINEYLSRYEIFKKNYLDSFSNEEKTYKSGITKFSDLTKEEFSKTYLNLNFDPMAVSNINPTKVKNKNDAPISYDWRDYGIVSPVKDQGVCSAAYILSALGNLEGLYAKEKGIIKAFSIQMLIDCDTLDSGCNGGSMVNVFNWLKKNGGIMFEADYPYTGRKSTCKSSSSKYADMKITGYIKLGDSFDSYSPADEDEMKEFLYENGPLSIAINADPLQMYSSGILDLPSSKCPSSGINHAVLLVGYGVDSNSGLNYWIVKNSWGKSWGESGYFRIRRGNGTCGVNCYVLSATVSF